MKLQKMCLFLAQLFILYLINEAGYLLTGLLNLPLPGNVVGIIILFLLLWSGLLKLTWIQEASSFLLEHLVFFFIPITVGVMTLSTTLMKHGVSIFFILLVSAAIGMITTGKTTQMFWKKGDT